MSIHLLEAAAELDLPASRKLVLLAFADSADTDTRVAWPGLERVMRWAGVRRSRAEELIRELIAEGHLERLRGAAPGRRAEFLVLPAHACERHPALRNVSDPDPSTGANVSGRPAPNVSDLAPDVSDLAPDVSAQTGPLPSVPPSDPSPVEPADRVRLARAGAGLSLDGWHDDACTAATVSVLSPTVSSEQAWRALELLAVDPTTTAPGRLRHRADELLREVRRLEHGEAHRRHEAQAELERRQAAEKAARDLDEHERRTAPLRRLDDAERDELLGEARRQLVADGLRIPPARIVERRAVDLLIGEGAS